jgi:hypothetical protein
MDSSQRTAQVAAIAYVRVKKGRDDAGVPKPHSIAPAIKVRLSATKGYVVSQ